ncbi:unnamed protein product [Polarella glacialis]|uniref:Uncharacterized protein n=1 Tax=Polarella glacialis TaxID=89957 RepID=A0A813LYQ8_POLGL|nr:unnamed protein product [Polarella glacialis]
MAEHGCADQEGIPVKYYQKVLAVMGFQTCKSVGTPFPGATESSGRRHLDADASASECAWGDEACCRHGTAGGGIVVTPDSPKAAEIQSVPVYVRSALLYAQGKERLIASNNSLRCDVLPPVGAAQVKLCGVTEFRQWLLSEVSLLEQAVATTNNEADAVKGRFLSDLKDALQPMLGWIRSLLQAFNCNAMWRRVEELDRSFCEEVAPLAAKGTLMMMLLAACAICSIIVQYKAWRRLKDNKILQEEVERFERRLRAHAIKMQEQDARQREEHGLSAMAPTGVSLQLDDELDEDEEQEDFSDHPLH